MSKKTFDLETLNPAELSEEHREQLNRFVGVIVQAIIKQARQRLGRQEGKTDDDDLSVAG